MGGPQTAPGHSWRRNAGRSCPPAPIPAPPHPRVCFPRWLASLLIAILPALFVIVLYIVNNSLPEAVDVDQALALERCVTFNVYGQV